MALGEPPGPSFCWKNVSLNQVKMPKPWKTSWYSCGGHFPDRGISPRYMRIDICIYVFWHLCELQHLESVSDTSFLIYNVGEWQYTPEDLKYKTSSNTCPWWWNLTCNKPCIHIYIALCTIQYRNINYLHVHKKPPISAGPQSRKIRSKYECECGRVF